MREFDRRPIYDRRAFIQRALTALGWEGARAMDVYQIMSTIEDDEGAVFTFMDTLAALAGTYVGTIGHAPHVYFVKTKHDRDSDAVFAYDSMQHQWILGSNNGSWG